MKTLSLFFFTLYFCLSASAQTMSLQEFNTRYEQELGKITRVRIQQKEQLNIKYLGALLRMETQAKNEGNLDLLQATRSEIARVESGQAIEEPTEPVPQALQDMRTVMRKLDREYQQTESKKIVALVDNLKTYASTVSSEYTRQNQIDKAVAWQKWEKNVEEDPLIQQAYASQVRQPAAPSPNHRDHPQPTHSATRGRTATIHEEQVIEFSESPAVYRWSKEPKGKEKRIRSTTPSMQGAGISKLTGTLILIEEKDINKSGWSGNYKEKSLLYVPRLSISPLVGKSLDPCLVVFDLYKRGSGSKRSIIRTDSILIPSLKASDRVVVDAGVYEYETEEYDSSWSSYDYKHSTEDEFYGFIVTIFNQQGELIFQRASERILNEYARTIPPK
ncbi:hypothetical protein P3T73_01950 [Kiritimatiellota bacterium B12222]|nr:hypothetical protein P3T73_01950 [Kiritimatiellota bacterium B12222]